MRWQASSRWAAAAQFALAVSLTSSQNDLLRFDIGEDMSNIVQKTEDAVTTQQGVLEGKHDEVIDDMLHQHQVRRDGWWSAFYRIIEGLAAMSRLAQHNRLNNQSSTPKPDP
ncbi:ABC transporter C family member 1-like [Durio zibethinus]|uniref:ABC transporter C family member 1-like n=1 Tax=Durio zibethinus TaxID=66656 RepID=A0A6P6ACU6_DURZI|nr:ABC transporter C family member 1-like [Durio zibethinus]